MATVESKLKLTLLDQISGRAKAITGVLDRLYSQQNRFMSPVSGTLGQVAAFASAYLGVTKGVDTTIGAAISFESAFADVRKVVDATDEQLQNMERTIRQLSTVIPATANDLAALYAAGAESGIATNELNQFAEMASKVGIAFDIPMDQAGESLAKLKTQLGLTLTETGDLADAMNHLSNNMASKASDIQAFMLRVGALAEMGGLAKEEIAALGSAMIAAGAEPEVASTALQNVVKAMTRGTSAKKAQKDVAKALGLDLPQLAKDMQKDAPKAIKRVLTAISKAPKDRHISLLSDFFGDEAKAFAPLIGNIKLLDDALASVSDRTKYSGSAFREYVERSKTTANVLQVLQNKVSEFGRAIGDDMLPTVKGLALGVGDLFDTLGQRATIFDQLTTAVRGFLNGLGFDGSAREAMNDFWDTIFGPADGSASADKLGRIFMQFKEFGTWLREQKASFDSSPVGQLLTQISGMGFKLMLAGVGIGVVASTVAKLAGALYFLSGASTAVGILRTIAELQTKLNAGTLGGAVTTAGSASGTAFGTAFAAAAGAAMAAGLLLVLRELDPNGSLGGLTKPIDDFVEKMTGWNPGRDGLGFNDVLNGASKLLPGRDGIDRLWSLLSDDGSIKPEVSGATNAQQLLAIDNARRGKAYGFAGTTDTEPGKLKDDFNIGVASNLSEILARMRSASQIIPTNPSSRTYLDDTGAHPLKLDAASIAAMIQPAGVQDVRVTNKEVPNVTVHAPISISGVVDPQAAASSVASQLGETIKSAVESADTD